MIAGWKVRRELIRLGQQLRALPEALWERGATRRYDAAFPAQVRLTEGAYPALARIALLLIYPRPVLAQSTVQLCASLSGASFAPLVVSNAPLEEADRVQLAPHVWRLAERPNLGHDFGGYRDGLRLLRHWNLAPEEVLILNDSVWLTHGDASDLLGRLRAVDADVAGSILRDKDGALFLESYCYLMPGHVLRDPQVIAYWDALVLTSNKYKVIRRGERGYSAALQRAGYRLGAAFDVAGFHAALDATPTPELCAAVRHAGWLYAEDAAAARRICDAAGGDGQRQAVLDLIRSALRRGQFYSLFPVIAQGQMGYPFLKRSGDRVSVLWRDAYLSAVNAGDLPAPDPVVLAELRAKIRSDKAEVDLA